MVSRYRGESASPSIRGQELHLHKDQVIKDLAVPFLVPGPKNPGTIYRKRVAQFLLRCAAVRGKATLEKLKIRSEVTRREHHNVR